MKMRLSRDQLAFLEKHNISREQVFDAMGRSPAVYGPLMSTGGFLVAINVTPCKAEGHVLRTSRGYCVQCKPANLGFTRNYQADGYLYLAKSNLAKCVKVGVASQIIDREKSLRQQAYGGFDDWVIVQHLKIARAGVAEKRIHSQLSEFRYESVTFKSGRKQGTFEMFKCDLTRAKRIFTSVVKDLET